MSGVKSERLVFVKHDTGYYEEHFWNLKKGDIFKLYEEDGTPVLGLTDHDEFIALTDAEYTGDDERYPNTYIITLQEHKEEEDAHYNA